VGIIDRLAERFGYRKADRVQADWLRMSAEQEGDNIPSMGLPRTQLELYQKLSWVQSSVSAVARTAATTAFSVSKLNGEKTEAVENHPFELLLRRPNPLQSRFELLESTVSYHRLTGNAYWWLNRKNENAAPDEIWVIPSYRVKPVPDGKLFIRGYMYETDNGDELPLEPHEIVHFKSYHPLNPFVGMSPLESLSTIAAGDLAMQKWNTNLFDKDNAKMPGAIAFADPIENDAWEKIKADINAKHGGTKRALMMLRNVGKGGVQWISMAVSQKDMEFLAGRTFNKEEIYSIYAPGLASILAVNATEANAKAGKATFVEMAVWPQLVSIAETITNNVLPAYGDNFIGAFDDIRVADRAMIIAEQTAAGQVQTIDEVRQKFYNLPPLPDDRGARLMSEPMQQSEAAVGMGQQFVVHDYHIKSGIITKDEARAIYGMPPISTDSPTELESKFRAVSAGMGVGVPAEPLFRMLSLPVDLLPSVDSVITQPQRQLPAPQDTPSLDQPQDQALEVGTDMRQQEAKAYRKWLKRKSDRHWSAFKAAYLTQSELESIYTEVRQGVAPDDTFFREWQSYP